MKAMTRDADVGKSRVAEVVRLRDCSENCIQGTFRRIHTNSATGPQAERRPRRRRRFRFVAVLAALTLAVLLVRGTVLDWHRVAGRSMSPTLHSGQWILCNRLAYGLHLPGLSEPLWTWAQPRPGEIVVFFSPLTSQRCVKRVAVAPQGHAAPSDGGLWLLGDNPDRSFDSRHYGFVPCRCLAGRVVMPVASLARRE